MALTKTLLNEGGTLSDICRTIHNLDEQIGAYFQTFLEQNKMLSNIWGHIAKEYLNNRKQCLSNGAQFQIDFWTQQTIV